MARPFGAGVTDAVGVEPQVPATVVRYATPVLPLARTRTQLCMLSAM